MTNESLIAALERFADDVLNRLVDEREKERNEKQEQDDVAEEELFSKTEHAIKIRDPRIPVEERGRGGS